MFCVFSLWTGYEEINIGVCVWGGGGGGGVTRIDDRWWQGDGDGGG